MRARQLADGPFLLVERGDSACGQVAGRLLRRVGAGSTAPAVMGLVGAGCCRWSAGVRWGFSASNVLVITPVQGQCRASRRMRWRPVLTNWAAAENRHKRSILGLPATGVAGQGTHGHPGEDSSAREAISSQTGFCAVSCRGRRCRPVSRRFGCGPRSVPGGGDAVRGRRADRRCCW
jgi:hypothetical protein